MNILILIAAAVVAYLLMELYNIIDGLISKYLLWYDNKQTKKNDILMRKIRKLFGFYKNYYIALGYSNIEANEQAREMCEELRHNNIIDIKYQLLR